MAFKSIIFPMSVIIVLVNSNRKEGQFYLHFSCLKSTELEGGARIAQSVARLASYFLDTVRIQRKTLANKNIDYNF